MYCWYCYWGWHPKVKDIFNDAVEKLDGDDFPLLYGPAHIVWADENFERHSIEWCVNNFNKYDGNLNQREKEIVMESLVKLLELPDEVLESEPEDYDGENPENFKPAWLNKDS